MPRNLLIANAVTTSSAISLATINNGADDSTLASSNGKISLTVLILLSETKILGLANS